ncbi:MAG TPA: ion channel [Gaiellales bacterium]|nr:ion channel [Gaiellales bacterium]
MGAIRDEWRLITSYGDHHRRLLGRLGLVLVLTVFIDVLGAIAMFMLERHSAGSQIRTIGDALFFSTVQLLTVSSQMPNPVTSAGRVVDVVLEVWAVIVVAGSAGAIASFFQSNDR